MSTKPLRVRRSLIDIYNDFKNGKPSELEKLMVAWQFIKNLPANDPNSFMTLGGYHGEPFTWRGSYDGNYWGGYCNHGNIFFPTWHRVYLHKLEKALQSVPGCESVMLPYWDQTYKVMKDGKLTFLGVPSILTDNFFTFSDGTTISNPLKSFKLPVGLYDWIEKDAYSKPEGYETVRFPLSGLIGTPADRMASENYNMAFYIPGTTTINEQLTSTMLNENVTGWLSGSVEIHEGFDPSKPYVPEGSFRGGIDEMYHRCLLNPYYTTFSNNTSRNELNKTDKNAQSLESPHGSIHLAVGGINAPGQDANSAGATDANGDMGENETAGLDPIFFFHHCNVDRIFWMWQVRHKSTDKLDLTVPGWEGPGVYPGQNNVNNQPPVGYEQEEQLTLESPLYPFKMVENGVERNFCTNDVINIEKQLGFRYESLSLDNNDGAPETIKAIAKLRGLKALAPKSDKALVINGINRAKINGSFVLSAFATIDGNRYFIGSEPVLSRWKVTACKNCMTNLEVTATFSLSDFTEDEIARAIFDVQINGRKHNDAEFAKFTVTNNANATRMLTAANVTTAKFMNLMAKPAEAQVPAAHSKAFHLSVV